MGRCSYDHSFTVYNTFIKGESQVTHHLKKCRDFVKYVECYFFVTLPAQKKDIDRRKGHGRRFCLGVRIYSIPCRASCFAMVLKNRLNSSFFSNYPSAIHSFIQNFPMHNSQRGKEFNKLFPPNRSDDLCLFFCPYPSSMPPRLSKATKVLELQKMRENKKYSLQYV